MVTKTVLENEEGELYLQFASNELVQLGWQIGDRIEWIDNNNGSFSLKKDNKE